MTSTQAIVRLKAELEYKRCLKDKATGKQYTKLRDEVDVLVTRLQRLGGLGCLDLETMAGPEEDQ